MEDRTPLASVTATLRAAGCVAAEDEASELLAATEGDPVRLAKLVAERVKGEPLAWLIGWVQFCDERVLVERGVYVPRWQSEPLARRAIARLRADGVAIDLCTGAGAIARVLRTAQPTARVIGTELDPLALACAARNGVEVYRGDLTAAIPPSLRGRADVITAVCPYVPTDELELLPRDVLAYESRLSLDGGIDGTTVVSRAARESTAFLRPGGTLLLELGGDEAELIVPLLDGLGYVEVEVFSDEDDDVRGIEARWPESERPDTNAAR
jgi:release factor glutamine methyltransferase